MVFICINVVLSGLSHWNTWIWIWIWRSAHKNERLWLISLRWGEGGRGKSPVRHDLWRCEQQTKGGGRGRNGELRFIWSKFEYQTEIRLSNWLSYYKYISSYCRFFHLHKNVTHSIKTRPVTRVNNYNFLFHLLFNLRFTF